MTFTNHTIDNSTMNVKKNLSLNGYKIQVE